MADIKFLQGLSTTFKAEGFTPIATTFYHLTDTNDFYLGSIKLSNAADLALAVADIAQNAGDIATINDTLTKLENTETVSGSIRNIIKGYFDAYRASDLEYKAATEDDEAVSVKDALDDIYEQIGEGGAVADQIDNAISDLNSSVAATAVEDASGNVNVLTGVTETGGKLTAKTEQLLKKLAVTGAAEDVSVADTANNFTATNLEAVLAEIAGMLSDGNDAGKVTVETPSSSDYAAVYEFYQGVLAEDDAAAKAAKKLTTINIPKDMVVSGAALRTVETADDPYTGAKVGDKYIELTIANAANDKIYLPVNALVDVYTGNVGTEVTIAVSDDNVISATINKVAASKIVYKEADDSDPDNVVAEETVAQALARLDGAASTGVDNKISAAIQELNADLDAATDATITDEEKVAVVTGVTEVNGKLTAVDSIDVDKAGAASRAKAAVIGVASDAKTADTVNGAKAFATDAVSNAKSELIGTAADAKTVEDGVTTYADTIEGAKAYADDKVSAGLTWGTF